LTSIAASLKSFNTILVLEPKKNGYQIKGLFAPHPFKNINSESIKKLNRNQIREFGFNTVSTLAITKNDEIYQVFTFFPLIRKLSQDLKLCWVKEYTSLSDFSVLNSITIQHTGRYQNIIDLPVEDIT
jgi:hypothetical protein